MAKTRMINTKFWCDSWIVDLDPLERYLFLYLLTNEHTNIVGTYELPITRMAQETGLDKEMLPRLLKRFEKDSKVFYFDSWVYIKNFSKHQNSDSSKIKTGIENAKRSIPSHIQQKIDTLSIPYQGISTSESESESESELKSELEFKSESHIAETSSAPEVIPNLLNDKQKHVQIIGLYAKAKSIDFSTLEKQRSFIRRNTRPAINLAPYPPQKIIDTMKYLVDNADFKWTLESVGKYIDEDLNMLKFNKAKTIIV